MTIESVSSDVPSADAAQAHKLKPTRHHQILIVGGGTGGVTAAAQLCRKLRDPDVAVIEPSETHDYQPLWTLVGGGVVTKEKTRRRQADVLPRKATWIRQAVVSFEPAENAVTLDDGTRVGYDYLIVAVGIKLNWGQVKGLSVEQIGHDGVCSNYGYDTCEKTWSTLQQFQGGNAVFTMPPPPIKCAPSPSRRPSTMTRNMK